MSLNEPVGAQKLTLSLKSVYVIILNPESRVYIKVQEQVLLN